MYRCKVSYLLEDNGLELLIPLLLLDVTYNNIHNGLIKYTDITGYKQTKQTIPLTEMETMLQFLIIWY